MVMSMEQHKMVHREVLFSEVLEGQRIPIFLLVLEAEAEVEVDISEVEAEVEMQML